MPGQKEEDGQVVWYKETPKALLGTQTAPADMEIDGKVLSKGKKFLKKHKCKNYFLLKCTSSYPSKYEDLNLNTILL